ncbi:U2 snRNP-associated SURP domain-containing protein [Bachmanniomyces sp. S44760]|nr:U2 snRNP-associated SURP domain-containing protein [Bachmanniomyces sp. S44760]
MAQDSKIKEFPDIGSKLTAPTKKSIFERQKADAEAKRQREQQETAAVYEDFVKSFDDEDEDGPIPTAPGGRRPGGGGFGVFGSGGSGGPSKRHFQGPPPGPGGRGSLSSRGNSGPGSLGPPPSSLSRKKAFDGSISQQRESSQGLFAFEDSSHTTIDTKAAFQTSDDDEEKAADARSQDRAVPKPTIYLSSLPQGTSQAVVRSLLPKNLAVDAVRILPPSGPGTSERRSLSAIATLAKDTPAIDIDTAVSALQNKYLGWGFYLSLSRHLSSASIGSNMTAPSGASTGLSSLPFGARQVSTGPAGGFGRGAPAQSHRGGFAPPSSYGSGQFGRNAPLVHVPVTPPSDIKQLKLIHKTLESLLTHGPEFEALLMSRSEVQKDEKWAWLWNSRSAGGVWYRWRLWEIITGAQSKGGPGRGRKGLSQFVFDGGAAWTAPEKGLAFEYTTEIEEFVSESDYNSSDDEDSGDEGRRRPHHTGGGPPPNAASRNQEEEDHAYLNPLQKAKLVHLLARLPLTNAKLRKGDVARITAFAIQHAGEGAEEVVDLITLNVQKPLAYSSANPERRTDGDDAGLKEDVDDVEDEKKSTEREDTSASKLIALYIISDILSSSSTSGVRHAWRYRQLFETALKQKQIFEGLGRLEKELHLGRLRAEKWKRSVNNILSLWEGWCVFPQASQEQFSALFANPPLTAAEEAAIAADEKAVAATQAGKSRWKTVEEKAMELEASDNARQPEAIAEHISAMDVDVDGEAMPDDADDVDGQPMEDDEDLDGEPMEDVDESEMIDVDDDDEDKATQQIRPAHINGDQPGHVEDDSHKSPSNTSVDLKLESSNGGNDSKATAPAGGRRKRPKAEDMFADSDGE